MMLGRRLGLLLVLITGYTLASLASAGCQSSTSTTGTTSAQKYAAGSPELRTVDNAGYVDPGGRTRQVTAGASTVGRGESNIPPPRRESPSGSGPTESAPATPGLASASADPTEFTERAARALCDRESYCGRIGAGKAFESADACMVGKRERVHRAMSEGDCREIRGEGVSRCLTAIRGAECGAAEAPLQPPPACTADALCK